MKRTAVFLILHILVIFSVKAQNGEPFRVSARLSFPQLESTNDLNSLQVLAIPLAGEPYSLDSIFKNAIFTENDNPQLLQNIINPLFHLKDNILEVSKQMSGAINNSLWSSHSFSTSKGGIAYRYRIFADEILNWSELNSLHTDTSVNDLVEQGNLNLLSPLEKYELLIGDSSFSLSKKEWSKGQAYFDRYAEVPSWIGICHGSAPSTFRNIKPIKSINLKSSENLELIFYPTDLKALIAFSWAQSGGPSAIMGSRCSSYLQPHLRAPLSCRDTNPASFHLALTNIIGIQGKEMIADVSAGPEVWNKVIHSYKYSFFRPGTRNLSINFSSSLIKLSSFTADPYKPYRSLQSTHLVGISMEVTYLKETKFSIHDDDTAEEYETIRYWYDLEIDIDGKVIGGEWYNHTHPDFLWVVSDNYQPKTIFDHVIAGSLINFTGAEPLSPLIRSEAIKASERGQILFELIDHMLKLSQ